MTNSKEIAQTILEQLGGRMFIMMTGAKNLVIHERGLSFTLPSRSTRNNIKFVRIDLDPSDTYNISFDKLYKMELKNIAKHDGIYCDMLRDLFEKETGLLVSM